MKTTDRILQNSGTSSNYLASCRRIITELEQTKEAIAEEFRGALEAREHLLHLALNEAEALAWESGVPQLIFPTLALEKVQAVATWHARQKSVRRGELAFAA